MTLIWSVLGLFPWYVWVLIVLGVVIFTYAGMWPLVFGFLRRVPWQLYALLGAGIVAVVWLNYHDATLRDAVAHERNTFYEAREKAANKAHADAVFAMHRKLEIADSNALRASTKARDELAARSKSHAAAVAALAEERRNNVTEKANADCRLTAGVILHFNRGASSANGPDTIAAPASPGAGLLTVDSASGVTLDTYVAGVEATQAALGAARNQVKGWQNYYATVVKPWTTSTLEALSTCIPKGRP